ncbi:LOG family protein [Chachezhania sediminis]|uniref:LOG family protein n=1 Tax=Chachezhania sediminis TaxID=2599291 RepID=UPI00131C3173|nr:TIGR00730 family Rossman fold protein [Chachezhania sediminis]
MSAKSVCVYCGSRAGADPAYAHAAEELGRALADQGWQLVYGAGDVGLMGIVARTAQAAGGETFGVIPTHLLKREVGKTDLSRFVVTETMHERKKVMFMNSDAVIVLPGGAGTLDEFFEVLTWAQLGLHQKPVVVLDIAGFWGPLDGLVRHIIDQGFADPSLADLYDTAPDPAAAIERLKMAFAA